MAQRRIVLKLSSRRRTDWRILSIFGFAHVNWFLIDSYKKRAWKIWEQSDSWRQWWKTQSPRPMKNRPDFSQAIHHLIAIKQQAEKPNPHIPKHFRFRQRPNWRESEFVWNVNGKVGLEQFGPQSSCSSSHKNGKNKYSDPCSPWFFQQWEDHQFCFGCDLRQWRRGACRSDCNTTSARLSVAWKSDAHACREQIQHVEKFSASNSCKGSTRLLPCNYPHEHRGQHGEGKAPSQTAKCFALKQKFEGNSPAQLSSEGHVIHSLPLLQKQDALRIRTSHASFRLHAIPGTTCPGLYGRSRLPLPPPSLVRCERGVVGQRARLLIGRSVPRWILLRTHPHGRWKGRSQSSGGWSGRWERQVKSAKRGSKREQDNHSGARHMDGITRTKHLSQCRVWHNHYKCTETREKKWRVRCTVYTTRRLQQIVITCKRTYYNIFSKKKKS